MSTHRSLPPLLRAALVAVAALVAPGLALAQDSGAEEPPPPVETPPEPTPDGDSEETTRAPEPTPAVADAETTESWVAFSLAFAQQLRERGRIPDAVEEYVAIAALRPDDRDVVAEAAVLLVDHATTLAHGMQPGSPYAMTADSLVRMGVSRNGIGDPRLAYVIGRLRLAESKWSEAYLMLREARAAGYPVERLRHWVFIAAVNRAPDLLDAGRAPEAIEELEALIEDQPGHPDTLEAKVNLAAAYRRNNDRVLSQSILEELSRQYPQDHRPWAGLGREHLDQGRLDESLSSFRKALALSGADRDAYAQSLASIALVLYKLGRLDESEQAAQGFIELDSSSASALHLLAMLRRERGETLEAIKLLRRADRLERDDPSVLTLLEQIHYERGEDAEARAVRERRDRLYREPGKPSERERESPEGGD